MRGGGGENTNKGEKAEMRDGAEEEFGSRVKVGGPKRKESPSFLGLGGGATKAVD